MPRRRRHVSSSTCETSGNAAGSAASAETSALSTVYPWRIAGCVIASYSSSELIAPTMTCASLSASTSSGNCPQCPWKSDRTPTTTRASVCSSAWMNAARSSASRHRVKTSSNWSTTTRSAPSAERHSASGCAPGVISFVTPEARATSPARSTDDLPEPDAPNTPTNRFSATFACSLRTSLSRPKKRSASSGWNAPSPTYGEDCSVSGMVTSAAAACHLRRQSSSSPPQARTYASVTASVGSLRPPAASASTVTE
ncbi:hypothetical protein FKR81_18385 [Lentzea tibetensis]|uniref:Uncharacterized protein n=1 Tax=Lentzea tibetensis TaxID=2591470 RepID=A0A563ETN8_9PSEU|nr:hypothetical protein [Lentzea tibetensis]TWP51036.1 hypothetical protein FKR81_18385 [Lentzea tibetensis]